jgi:hypothetical protein
MRCGEDFMAEVGLEGTLNRYGCWKLSQIAPQQMVRNFRMLALFFGSCHALGMESDTEAALKCRYRYREERKIARQEENVNS